MNMRCFLVLAFCLIVVGCTQDHVISNNTLPQATFTSNPTSAGINQPLTFDATGSIDSDGAIERFDWNFGDGGTASGKTVSHVFQTAGTFTVTLTVTDNQNGASNFSKNVNIANNLAPVGHYNVIPKSGGTSTIFQFDAQDSTDADGHIVQYKWYFSDNNRSEGKKVTHKYSRKGTYTVQLVVTDNGGLTSNVQKDVIVVGQRPVANFTVSPPSGLKSTNFRFDASNSHDPDGNIREYLWNFGDGNTQTGKVVLHQFSAERSYSVKLTLTDNDGDHATSQQTVDVLASTGEHGSCQNAMINQTFTVLSRTGNELVGHAVVSESIYICPRKCADLRRPHATGGLEFAGDINNIHGNEFDYTLVGFIRSAKAPQVGEVLGVAWKNCK
jgi:PKD repeat protein